MDELINRDELYKKLEGRYKFSSGQAHKAYGIAIDDVCDAPTIDPESLRLAGRWEKDSNGIPYCTNCGGQPGLDGSEEYDLSDFCPRCGARTEG